jgi:hypothetical protein
MRDYAHQQWPLRFILRWQFYFDLGAVRYGAINHAPYSFQSPKHIAATASRKKRPRCEFKTFTGPINFLEAFIRAKNINSVGEGIDGRLPNAVGGHQ